MSRVRAWLGRVINGIDAEGDIRTLSVLRILLGPIVLLHLEDYFRDAADGITYRDRFWLPYADWYPEASSAVYEPMLWAAGVAAIAMSLGLLTRLATTYTAFFVGYNIFLSKTHFAHNRAFLLILLITVAVVPTGRHYSLDNVLRRIARRPRSDADAPLWPLWLVRFEVVAVYCASAVSKVIDQDWWSGRVLQLRAIDNRQLALDEGAPAWLLDVLADETFQWWFSKGAVLMEFVIGLGFLFKRTRLLAIWLAIPFHLAIQFGARVQVFSWAALAALVVWVTPRVRDRQLVVPRGHALGRWTRLLDWFGRFDVRRDDGQTVVLLENVTTDREVITRWGRDATLTTLSRLPVTFFAAAPALALRRVRRRES